MFKLLLILAAMIAVLVTGIFGVLKCENSFLYALSWLAIVVDSILIALGAFIIANLNVQ